METNNLFEDIQQNTPEPEEQRWVAATRQAAHDYNISHDRPSQALARANLLSPIKYPSPTKRLASPGLVWIKKQLPWVF